jgi:hypothetical protein
MADRTGHWETVYRQKAERELSWHKDDPAVSLDLAGAAGLTPDTSVIDIGGGTSRLAAACLARGLRDVTMLDLSQAALDAARARLGPDGDRVTWIAADVTRWTPRGASTSGTTGRPSTFSSSPPTVPPTSTGWAATSPPEAMSSSPPSRPTDRSGAAVCPSSATAPKRWRGNWAWASHRSRTACTTT